MLDYTLAFVAKTVAARDCIPTARSSALAAAVHVVVACERIEHGDWLPHVFMHDGEATGSAFVDLQGSREWAKILGGGEQLSTAAGW
ncbi:MAG: hypothetical protein AB7H93_10525 [Vicinamibacterales bacterium]